MPIDPSKVQWDDAPSSQTIDPNKVTWDAPASSTQPQQRGVVQTAENFGMGLARGAKEAPFAAQTKEPEPRNALQQLGRGVGLAGRAAVQGVMALPGMVSDAVTGPINAGLDLAMGKGDGFRFQKVSSALDNAMTAAGVAKPENSAERIGVDVGSAVTGVSTAAKAADLATRGAGAVAKGVGQMFGERLGMQAASAATGSGASGAVRESGGSTGAQVAAGLAGGLAPTMVPFAGAAAARGIVRGGEAGRQRMAENIKTFEDATGVTPSLGQATQRRGVQGFENIAANVVGGQGLMARRAEVQAKAMQDAVQTLSDNLAPNASAWSAGEAITKGVKAFKDGMKTTQNQLYGKLDEFVPAQTPVNVNRTKDALAALNEGIEGAPNLSQMFRNAKIGGIEKAFLKDLDEFANGRITPGMRGMGVTAESGQLPYQAVQKLRTLVGKEISEGGLASDVPRSKWKALYASLSDDLGSAAEAAGPKAQQIWSRANQYTRASIQRMDDLDAIINRDAPEKIFKAATSGLADGGTQINRVLKSLPEENRREVAAAVLQRLGRARSGQQNDVGDAFSSETFLTNLAGMSLPARRALFANSGMPGLDQKIGQMAKMANLRREGSQVFRNPSGTAGQAAAMGYYGALITAIASMNVPVIAKLAALPAGAYSAARITTSPGFARWAAQSTIADEAAPAVAALTAARTADADPQQEPIYRNKIQADAAARLQGGRAERFEDGWRVVR